MEKISLPHRIERFAILGSPSQAWDYLVEFYSVSPLTEKMKLEQEWYGLRMNSDETPTEYLGRPTLILGRRRQYGAIDISDSEANRHIARRLSSNYSWAKNKLLDTPNLDSETLERTINNACDEMTLSESLVDSSENHALVANSTVDASAGKQYHGGGKRRSPHSSPRHDRNHHSDHDHRYRSRPSKPSSHDHLHPSTRTPPRRSRGKHQHSPGSPSSSRERRNRYNDSSPHRGRSHYRQHTPPHHRSRYRSSSPAQHHRSRYRSSSPAEDRRSRYRSQFPIPRPSQSRRLSKPSW